MITNAIKFVLWSLVKFFFKFLFATSRPKPLDEKLRRAIDLYKGHQFFELFSKIRTWDAPYELVKNSVGNPKSILDLGCGDGLMVNYLALSLNKAKVTGIELNKSRLKEANKGIKNTSFISGSILEKNFSTNDVFLLLHVLHHLPTPASQIKVLKKIFAALKHSSKLVILEIDNRPIVKYWFSFLTDAFIVPILFESKLYDLSFHYRSATEWKKCLTSIGFKTSFKVAHKGMPFSHILIIATKL